MAFNVEINNVFDTENEKGHAFSFIKLNSEEIQWDLVTGYLDIDKSLIEVSNEQLQITATLYDSIDLDNAIFKLNWKSIEISETLSDTYFEELMNSVDLSFIGVLNKLVEKHIQIQSQDENL